MSEKIKNISMAHILKADSFAQQFIIDNDQNKDRKLIESNSDFFEFIFSQPNNSITVNGTTYKNNNISQWFKQSVTDNVNCVLLIVEGYAGCGKSTWVQSILYNQFQGEKYEYSYYNYNVGTHPGDKENIDPIKESLINDIIDQMYRVLLSDDGQQSFSVFNKIASLNYIDKLDKNTVIWDCFVGAKNIQDSAEAVFLHSDTKDKDIEMNFKGCAYAQLNSQDFNTYRLLCVDYLWRLSQFIANPIKYKNNFFVCYDNLDAIYDNEILNGFRNTLLQFRYNLNEFIIELNFDSSIKIKIPHFVIFTTYRKITEVRSEKYNVEMIQDIYINPNFVLNVEVSQMFDYISIVKKRLNHFKKKLNCDGIFGEDTKKIKEQIKQLNELINLNLFSKYANMLNFNYRSCGNILSIMINDYRDEMRICKKLAKNKKDGYNESKAYYIGASSVFLHVLCNILGQKGIWGSQYLDLTNHNNNKSKYTSLSRLILNYLSNNISESTSITEIFYIFDRVFDYAYICKIMGQMLKRASDELWRRPIYYAKNAFANEVDITNKFLDQYHFYKEGKTDLVEFTLCEGGKTFIEKISPHFEFYSSRLLPLCKSIYGLNKTKDLERVLIAVYKQIETCCEKQNEFRLLYMNKYSLSNEEYLNCFFHSKTRAGNLQLHIERVIFSHIGYLNDFRMYLINIAPNYIGEKDSFNELLLSYIDKYLTLYEKKINFISSSRQDVATKMREKLDIATRKNNPEKYISIDVDD